VKIDVLTIIEDMAKDKNLSRVLENEKVDDVILFDTLKILAESTFKRSVG